MVGAAGQALSAALDTRSKAIEPGMLNSAGSVSAEWYVETLWHYLFKRSLLEGVSSLDVVFKQPARQADQQLHFALPHPEAGDIVMDFHVRRRGASARPDKVPVAQITVHRQARRRRPGIAPDPPLHPYGIEVRRRHLNSARRVSWHTMVAAIMDVARRGAQFTDPRADPLDRTLLYVVPRFTFTPLGDALAPGQPVHLPGVRGGAAVEARQDVDHGAGHLLGRGARSAVAHRGEPGHRGPDQRRGDARRPVDEHGRVVERPPANSGAATEGTRDPNVFWRPSTTEEQPRRGPVGPVLRGRDGPSPVV